MKQPASRSRDRDAASSASRSVYEGRMHKVLEYIDRKIDEPLDLTTLAQVAHFSPFHFHRLFAAWMGERLGDYLRRRRLEIAATRLVGQPRTSVLAVALAVGFGSGEAFGRAFKNRFGCSPTSWRCRQLDRRRKHSNPDQTFRNDDQEALGSQDHHRRSFEPYQETSMNVRVVDRQPKTVAYLRRVGPYGEAIGRFWGEVVYPWMVTNGLLGRPRYGISHDDPSVVDPAQCRYDACVEASGDFVPIGNALETTIPGGKYAVVDFKGTSGEIGAVWTALLRDWLPSSGLQLDNRPCFEHYPADAECDDDGGVFACQICMPVARL
jgi:AraC family transcriptional regulator